MPRDLESAMTLSHKTGKRDKTVGLGQFLCCRFLGFTWILGSVRQKKEAKESKGWQSSPGGGVR
jgi:hypothetical protein